jgi:hypothetical protein
MAAIFARFYLNFYFLDRFSQKSPVCNVKNIRSVEVALMHAEGSADMENLTGAFRDYANAPVKGVITFKATKNRFGRAERQRTQLL